MKETAENISKDKWVTKILQGTRFSNESGISCDFIDISRTYIDRARSSTHWV
jgi:hypothetical protein